MLKEELSDSLRFDHPALPDIALTPASAVVGASLEATALVAVAESVRLPVTSRRQQQLKKALSARINLLAAEYQSLAVCLNSEYVRSEAFASHFLQAGVLP